MARCCGTTSWATELRRGAAGFTLVELMVAILLLAVGILATGTVLASATRYASASEARSSMAHLAQQEIERLGAVPYAQLAHASLPATGSTDPANPLHWYSTSAHTYQWDRSSGGATTAEPLVSDAAGAITTNPRSWSDGRLSGEVYSFVTWVKESHCGSQCPNGQNYKRLTVAVVLDNGAGRSGVTQPTYVSSIVADPHALPAGRVVNGNPNPLSDPGVQCQDASGNTVACTQSVGSATINQWYLSDTPATAAYAPPTGPHATHPTVAPTGTCTAPDLAGCPVPDLLSPSAPPDSTPEPPLYDYSTDQPRASPAGGRLLKRDVSCNQTPTKTDNAKGELWVTPPLASALDLTGAGGMTLNTQTVGGVTAGVTVCLGIYDIPAIDNLVATPGTRLGVVAYTVADWPTQPTPLSFSFDFLSTGTTTVPQGHRIGVRLWADASSGADIAAIYDHPSYASVLQLNSQ
jgi:type IV pilus assembly protein PilV